MDEHQWLAERFEENRTHLPAVAYRMLGSLAEADDAVQDTLLRNRLPFLRYLSTSRLSHSLANEVSYRAVPFYPQLIGRHQCIALGPQVFPDTCQHSALQSATSGLVDLDDPKKRLTPN